MRTVLPMPIKIVVYKEPASYTPTGAPIYTEKFPTKCAVLKLQRNIQDTTVRADSSGTRGHAQEVLADAWLLVRFDENIGVNDRIKILDFDLKVIGVRPRFGVFGDHDHNEVFAMLEPPEAIENTPVEGDDDFFGDLHG